MVNPNRKGREYENKLATYCQVHGYEAELLRLAGVVDRGDLWIPSTNNRVEVKAHDKILSALSDGIRDVELLCERFPLSDNVLVVRRPGQPTGEWYAVKKVKHLWGPDTALNPIGRYTAE